jgi:hypothetical protein
MACCCCCRSGAVETLGLSGCEVLCGPGNTGSVVRSTDGRSTRLRRSRPVHMTQCQVLLIVGGRRSGGVEESGVDHGVPPAMTDDRRT